MILPDTRLRRQGERGRREQYPERFLLQALTGLSYFERHPHAIGLIYNHMSIGLICAVIPAFALAQRHHRQARAIAITNGQPIALGHAHLGMGIHAHSLGQLRTALDEYEKSAVIFREIGHIRGSGGATMMRAWAYEDLGDFERALLHAESVSEVGNNSSDPQVRAWGLQRRGVSRRYTGRIGEAIADLETAIALSRQIPDYAGVAQGLALLALCHLDQGDRPHARQLVDEANRIRRERKLRGIWVAYAVMAAAEVSIAELDGPGGDQRALLTRAVRACREARRQGKTASHWLPVALRLQGNLHWRDGKSTAAERDWLRSAAVAEAIGARYALGLATAEIGRCLKRRRELERWLTVRVPGQPGRDILLEKIGPPSVDQDAAEKLRELIAKGASGFTAGFTTSDCHAVFKDLKAKGVEITREPVTQFYGIDIGIRDPFGNHIRIAQLADAPPQQA